MSEPTPKTTPSSPQEVAQAVQSARLDPTTPGPQNKPTALGAATTTALAGTPLAVVTVAVCENLLHWHLDSITATAVGSVGAAFAGYGFRVLQALLAKYGISPTEE